jgi:RND family efflux transporter MFP subunit
MFRRNLWPILLLGAAAIAGCDTAPPPVREMPPPDVVVSRAEQRQVTESEEFYGKTQGVNEVDIRARVSGYLEKINFQEGAEVHEKDVLFVIDPRPFATELEKQEANVAQADAHVKRLEYDYNRARRLLPAQGMSREEYDKAFGDLAEARATLKSALAARDTAKLNLDWCTVTAPVSGRVSRRMVDRGNMVKADDTVLTRIITLDRLYAYFDVDERTYLRAKDFLERRQVSLSDRKQVPVRVGRSTDKGYPYEGTVDFVDNRVDPDSGSVWLRGTIPNPERKLTSGLFVRVRLPLGEPHLAVLIPKRALVTDQGQKFVYVVNDRGEATYRQIVLGVDLGQVQVVEKGVRPGERVIVRGSQRVRIDPKQGFAKVRVDAREEPLEGGPDAPGAGVQPAE